LGRDERKAEADEEALQYIALHGSRAQVGKEEQPDDEIGAYHADECRPKSVCFAHIICLIISGSAVPTV